MKELKLKWNYPKANEVRNTYDTEKRQKNSQWNKMIRRKRELYWSKAKQISLT